MHNSFINSSSPTSSYSDSAYPDSASSRKLRSATIHTLFSHRKSHKLYATLESVTRYRTLRLHLHREVIIVRRHFPRHPTTSYLGHHICIEPTFAHAPKERYWHLIGTNKWSVPQTCNPLHSLISHQNSQRVALTRILYYR